MCSVRGQSHRLSLSLHYLRRLQGNTIFIAAHSVDFFFFSRRFWACGCLLCRGSSGGQSRRTSTQPTLVSMMGNASSTKWPETSARNVASRSALRWEWQPTVSFYWPMLLVCGLLNTECLFELKLRLFGYLHPTQSDQTVLWLANTWFVIEIGCGLWVPPDCAMTLSVDFGSWESFMGESWWFSKWGWRTCRCP